MPRISATAARLAARLTASLCGRVVAEGPPDQVLVAVRPARDPARAPGDEDLGLAVPGAEVAVPEGIVGVEEIEELRQGILLGS